ncbi:TetR family transcriptional regulator [Saccharibacillus sp. CPCC 101409]|uniref:TetR/AcrR family transcriptional regulator n=1 Tax=Saccharibacillus sp. CPCC 101409 TaxID=3058041 RepID=UPI002671C63E|nr:TetR family transcriptional regulator [Saccharibacillus sp. CPCC 101409]MDO3411217.1 TetR family transcriptional regulator [Saccharibacillus sp. CPCC 101409]
MVREEEHVKTRILYAAKKLIAQKGFEATTVREICREADANLSLVSYYYGGKEHVFEALLDAFIPMGEIIDRLRALKLEPVAGVCSLTREIVRFRAADPEISQIIHQEMTRRTPRTGMMQQRKLLIWRLMREYMEEGGRQNLFRFRSLDAVCVYVAGSILFGGFGTSFEPVLESEPPDVETQVSDVLCYILGGLGYGGEPEFTPERIWPAHEPGARS